MWVYFCVSLLCMFSCNLHSVEEQKSDWLIFWNLPQTIFQSDLSERGSFLEHMTRDKENLARAEDEVKQLKEKLVSLQEKLQTANTKLNVFDKVKRSARHHQKKQFFYFSFYSWKKVFLDAYVDTDWIL